MEQNNNKGVEDQFELYEENRLIDPAQNRDRALSDSELVQSSDIPTPHKPTERALSDMRDGPVQKGLNSNDASKGVLSEGEPSYMLSDGGTKRVKYADILLSPTRYVQRKFRAGGTSGSIFSLIAATLGSGTISFAYAIQQNGIILGIMLIILGASISYYTGMLLVKVSNKTQCNRYEDFAQKLYGSRCRSITSGLNLACLMGFITSYIVYIKSMLPNILLLFKTEEELGWIASDGWGQIFWATIFSFVLLFPLSLPRSINALRFSSLFGVMCSVYLSLAVFFVFYCDTELIPDPAQNFKDANLFTLTFSGVVSSFPLIIFAYMYQVNIPMIYTELEARNAKQMSRVLVGGTVCAVILYIIVGVWGYVTFVDFPGYTAEEALKDANILEAPYPKSATPILIGNFALFFAIATAAPLVVLPAKDTVEEIVTKGNPERRLSNKENTCVTLGLIVVCYLLSIVIPSISAAMTLVGSTTNPAVGFILPIVFYWKIMEQEKVPLCSFKKITAITVASFIIIISCLSLTNFFMSIGDNKDE